MNDLTDAEIASWAKWASCSAWKSHDWHAITQIGIVSSIYVA
jgi:hypothetical protein